MNCGIPRCGWMRKPYAWQGGRRLSIKAGRGQVSRTSILIGFMERERPVWENICQAATECPSLTRTRGLGKEAAVAWPYGGYLPPRARMRSESWRQGLNQLLAHTDHAIGIRGGGLPLGRKTGAFKTAGNRGLSGCIAGDRHGTNRADDVRPSHASVGVDVEEGCIISFLDRRPVT